MNIRPEKSPETQWGYRSLRRMERRLQRNEPASTAIVHWNLDPQTAWYPHSFIDKPSGLEAPDV
jgi:hypothetical protein